MVHMSPTQLQFWRDLLAPFPGEALSVKTVGGRELTYIDKRSLANRLDNIVGPDGWYAEYRDEGGRGLVCRLHLYVPTRDGWAWRHKEDGGSDEGMTKKAGGQQVEDTDNSFKSEFTNAFRRAAQDAWGIGRYLYQKGIPDWLDPRCPVEAVCGRQDQAVVGHPPREPVEARPNGDAPAADLAREAREQLAAPTPAERLDLPAAGRDVYAWVRAMEQRFKTSLLGGVRQGAEKRGLNPAQLYAWPQDKVNEIIGEAIDFIMTLPTYRGEFEHVTPGAPVPVAAPSEPPAPTAAAPANTGDPLAPQKRELMAKIGAHIERQLGVKPTNEQLKAAFQTVAAECQTGSGHVGEVPGSLKDLADAVWLRNMIALVDENLKRPPVADQAESNDIPF